MSAILVILTPVRCWASGKTCVTSKCHGEIKSGEVVHDPIKTEGCSVCHSEGGGKNPKLPKGHSPVAAIPRSEINELCLGCHDDFQKILAKAKHVHGPIEKKSCVSCHSPHSSKHKHLLKELPPKLCLQCHSSEVEANDKRMIPNIEALLKSNAHKHKPVADGGCLDCHVAHAGENLSLLKKPYTDQFYVAYDDGNYALCFECHDSALATKSLATDETGFRNGEQNLHFLHIQDKRKGRSCRACHEVHAAENSKLLSRWVPFKGLKIPLQYTGTPTGGNCVTACHGLKKYDRVKAVTNEKGK